MATPRVTRLFELLDDISEHCSVKRHHSYTATESRPFQQGDKYVRSGKLRPPSPHPLRPTPRVTAVARKRSRSFCQKCRWQVTAKHAYTLRMWLCMKLHGAWLYGVHRTCAETAAVSCGTSHASAVSTPLRWILKNKIKKNAL